LHGEVSFFVFCRMKTVASAFFYGIIFLFVFIIPLFCEKIAREIVKIVLNFS